MQFTRLFPATGTVDVEAHVLGLDLGGRAPADRPFTVANFVSSLDGRATVKGRSGGLGDDGDKALFRALRRASDAVLVGTGTMGTENYGRIVADPAARAARRQRGLPAEPLAVTVTRSGHLPLDIPLFAEPEARVVVYAGAPVDLGAARAQVQVVALEPARLSLAAVLRDLRAEHGVRLVLCEGGPLMLGSMLREGVLDQLCLSLAGKLTGGGHAPGVTAGPELPEPADARLEEALERSGTLFLRYAIASA
ncbi:MAG TPA: dihydrofolate reductase family protein [Solirubrobacteraceae bacterium]|nr:dihydrofolate reductase family protein [Solirubrobacteraceae bacterium]